MRSQGMKTAAAIAAVLALCTSLSGCIVVPARTHYYGGGGGYEAAPGGIWVEGYWGWIGGRRSWVDGHWEGGGRDGRGSRGR